MKKIFLLLMFIIFTAAVSYANDDMARGTKQYKRHNFKESAESFLKAQKNNPKDPFINYDLACAYYKSGQYDKALEYYDAALNNTKDANLKSSILYNMGNAAYKAGNKEESLNYYKSSLKLNSSDIQAKHNIEFIQNENKQNDKNNDKDNKNKNKSKDKNKEQQKNMGDKRKNGDDNDKKENNNKQDRQDDQQNKQNRQLLDYFDNQDKQNHDQAKEAAAVQNSKTGKNW